AHGRPPKVAIDGSSHGVRALQALSNSPAGTIDRPPSANVATTSHMGSGRARSKRRTKKSHANESAKGRSAHAAARPQLGGGADERRRSGGSTGDRRRSLVRFARE